MSSTHDWINNPLDIVENMFGKRHTGTSLSDSNRELVNVPVSCLVGAMLTAMLITC